MRRDHRQSHQAIRRILPSRLREGVRDLAEAAFSKQRGWHRTIRASAQVVDDEYAFGRWDYHNSPEPHTALRYKAASVVERLARSSGRWVGVDANECSPCTTSIAKPQPWCVAAVSSDRNRATSPNRGAIECRL